MRPNVSPLGSAPSGGTAALRGYIYQFDRTLLELFSRPEETIELEAPYDLHGTGWCGDVKYRSRAYVPSAISDGVKALWDLHQKDPRLELWLHCHFPDMPTGEVRRFTVSELRHHWSRRLLTAGRAASDRGVGSFARKLRLHFTADLPEQFEEVVQRIRTDFEKASREDAIATHAVLRAHLLHLCTAPQVPRAVRLSDLRAVDREHRACVLDHGYHAHLSASNYEKLVRSSWFQRSFNQPDVERAFLLDMPLSTGSADVVAACMAIAARFAKVPATRTGFPPRPPLVALRGLSDATLSDALNALYDQLVPGRSSGLSTPVAPFVDGYPFAGSRFRPDRLVAAGEARSTRLRILSAPDVSDVAVNGLFGHAVLLYQLYFGDTPVPTQIAPGARRIHVDDVDQFLRVLR